MPKILLTGEPGSGKTTLLQRILQDLRLPAGGFYTREIRQENARAGFEMVTLDGKSGILAHLEFRSPKKVGRYGVDLRTLEEIGVAAVEQALKGDDLVVIDEIGPMETFSEKFCEMVWRAMEAHNPLLGTVVKRRTPFSDRVKALPQVRLVEVTRQNRDHLAEDIVKLFQDP